MNKQPHGINFLKAQTKYNEYKYDRLKSLITDENKKIMFEKCKKYISRTLKSPSTAIWPNYNGDNVYYDTIEESNLITIAFSYEATNSFGAYLQSSVIYAFNENLELCDMLGRVIE